MRAVAQAQPNIALIKYWGKRDRVRNLPAVSSLSVTLDSLWTKMSVEFRDGPGSDTLRVNNAEAPDMLGRVSRCLDLVAGPARLRADVTSAGNFPIGAGLASSASAFAALVVATDKVAGVPGRGKSRDTQALARLAGASSGSAARSLYGGFVELTAGDEQISVQPLLAASEWPLEVIVAVTQEGPKAIGSGEAMTRGQSTSPFYSSWLSRQDDDLSTAREAVLSRDFAKLAAVAEHNCLKMHSVMWSSRPPIVYWNEATLSCLETIRTMQAGGQAVFFTIDAGPQVKAVCLPEAAIAVTDALRQTPGVISTLRSSLGCGATLVEAL
jgi:diphosphomevalonate decarboxylase